VDRSDYLAHDALGLAALVRAGQVSARELADCALALAAERNPRVNALLETVDPDAACAAAGAGGAFAGVPFLVKDLVLHQKDALCEMGSRLCAGLRAAADTELMARFRAAGLVTLGRTATPEMGYSVSTESALAGATGNPWNPALMAGGSSGGSAAAVAAGIVPLAHANDGGGSIRIPAACCGLVGLKPTRGRVPIGPDAAEGLSGLGIEFALTRSVRDAAALLDAVQGGAPGDPYVIPAPRQAYLESLALRSPRLRIALCTQPWSGVPVDPEIVQAVRQVARHLACEGYEIVESRPALDPEAFAAANTCVWSANIARWVDDICAATGRSPSLDTLQPATLEIYEFGRGLSAGDFLAALASFNTVNRSLGEFFTRYDLLLSPVTALLAQPLGTYSAAREGFTARSWTDHIFSFAPFTAVFNATGQPAISLPLARSRSGLPIGIQFAAGFGREDLLLALAARLEESMPWPQTAPFTENHA